MHSESELITMSTRTTLEDFRRDSELIMQKLKPEINNFLWERLPGQTTLAEMDEMAGKIYEQIDDHFDMIRDRLEGKESKKFQCMNCLEYFNATIGGIWGGKNVCPKCFVALLNRGKPEAVELTRLREVLRRYHTLHARGSEAAIREGLGQVYRAAHALVLGGEPDIDDEPFPPFPED